MSVEIESRFVVSPVGGSGPAVDHGAWQQMLAAHVKVAADGLNRVDYTGLKASDVGLLAGYIQMLEQTEVAALDRAEQFAFWTNLYNALTVNVVMHHFPVASIREIALGGTIGAALMGGPWKAKLTTVGDLALSLDDIEHTILRGLFKDPRLHYVINCGSVGCPNLRTAPLTGASLEADLDAAARDFINSSRGVAIENGKLVLSGIFKWYRRDFGGTERNMLSHIAQFADASRRRAIEQGLAVDRYDYDWRLNDVDR